MEKGHEELQELGHEPVPGYKKVFYIVLTIATIYLAFILFTTIQIYFGGKMKQKKQYLFDKAKNVQRLFHVGSNWIMDLTSSVLPSSDRSIGSSHSTESYLLNFL